MSQKMNSVAGKVAVVGSGISGAVCASTLARNGISVTIFESARGPGGRMSQRREMITEDGKELMFDHGAPCFSATNVEVLGLVHEWEGRGIVAEWKENFGTFDFLTKKFRDVEKDGFIKKYVGVPGMNSICKALCREQGVESKFGASVGRMEWLDNESLWTLTGLDGQELGHFSGVVASHNYPPLDSHLPPGMALKMQNIPLRPCFALMLALAEPLTAIPKKGFSFENSEVLSWAHCDSSKPGRTTSSECWVLHSTMEYARRIIAETGLFQKPSPALLTKVAEELFQEFQNTGLNIPSPIFMKAHRWGSAFQVASIAKEEKCIWDMKKRLAHCGDFCVNPDVEGAILSGIAAASKLTELLSSPV